jgi:hypothetical protein
MNLILSELLRVLPVTRTFKCVVQRERGITGDRELFERRIDEGLGIDKIARLAFTVIFHSHQSPLTFSASLADVPALTLPRHSLRNKMP